MANDDIFHYHLKGLEDVYFRELDRNHRLAEQLQNYNKDEEITKRDAEIDRLWRNSLYVMLDKEKERAEVFIKKHHKSCHNNTIRYELQGAGIGTIIKIICPVCGEVEDITDSDSW